MNEDDDIGVGYGCCGAVALVLAFAWLLVDSGSLIAIIHAVQGR